jgi:hypothetical protein
MRNRIGGPDAMTVVGIRRLRTTLYSRSWRRYRRLAPAGGVQDNRVGIGDAKALLWYRY